jgi:lysophospholipase L1-like esterase
VRLSFSRFVQTLERRCMLSAANTPAGVDGIGVLGDSYSDEYQFYAPDRSTAANWVEQLGADSNANFGGFSASDPAGARNAGYEYNWAVSGATSTDMIAGGQLSGVVGQVASGDVDLVTVFVGGNDFRDVFTVLATQGPAAGVAALQAAVPTVVTNIATATGTILSPAVLAANPDARVMLTTVPKLSYLPEVRMFVLGFPQLAPFVDAVDQATAALNQYIHAIAAGSGGLAALADFAALTDSWFAQTKLKVGNIEVERNALMDPTNDPTRLVLADGLHSGTIAQGLLGNLYVQTANAAFGTTLKELSSHDILTNAGLKSAAATPSAAAAAAAASARGFFASGRTIDGGRVVDDATIGLVG